jgi:ethanolamine utilization cobalamin adenosyltransferase
MPRQFFTAADIAQLARQQKSDLLLLSPDDVVTHEAVDLARQLGLRLIRETGGSGPLNAVPAAPARPAVPVALPPLKMVIGSSVIMEPFGTELATPGANVRLKDVVTSADGSSMAAGYMALEKGEFPWTLTYDEVDIVLEGELVITRGSVAAHAKTGDVIFIPKGSSITFGTPSHVRFIYVAFPANWNEQPGAAAETGAAPPAAQNKQTADWDKPGSFPVVLSGPAPVCSQCGQPLHAKPEHLTQLDAGHFASKTSPRLALRGRVDSLHGLVMLTASVARRFELPELASQLDTLAAYCREIMSAEYNLRVVAPLTLLGKNEAELHEISHWPEKHLGIAHLVPGPYEHEILHWLNVLRTQAREVEIVALEAFPSDGLDPAGVGASLARAFNRLSSAVYVLELYFQSGKLSWKVTG